jgi:hypothetical protein
MSKSKDIKVQEAMDRADAAAMQFSKEFSRYKPESSTFALEAATKLISNHEAVVADCTRTELLSQKQNSPSTKSLNGACYVALGRVGIGSSRRKRHRNGQVNAPTIGWEGCQEGSDGSV